LFDCFFLFDDSGGDGGGSCLIGFVSVDDGGGGGDSGGGCLIGFVSFDDGCGGDGDGDGGGGCLIGFVLFDDVDDGCDGGGGGGIQLSLTPSFNEETRILLIPGDGICFDGVV
jgi:hypothetical protein